MNTTIIMGNLTRDVELKYTQANKPVCQFSIAHNSKYKAGDGTMKEDVIFLDCEAWNATAENIAKFFTKGKPILVEGFLKQESWTGKDGTKKTKIKLKVERFHFCGGNKGDAPAAKPAPTSAQVTNDGFEPIQPEDVPF